MGLRDFFARIAGRETSSRAATARSRSAQTGGPAGEARPGTLDASVPDDDSLQREAVLGVLVAIDGELEGEIFPLHDGDNRLGRSEAGEIVLASQWISREHAILVHHDGIFALVPLSESNRTYVNGEEVDGIEVADSDLIRLGHTTFRFRTIEGM